MDPTIIQNNKDRLIKSIPVVNRYIDKFRSINNRWVSEITAGSIETGCMPDEAARLFTPLIQDMRSTMTKYGEIQGRLVDAILFEMAKKVIFEVTDAAKFAMNILITQPFRTHCRRWLSGHGRRNRRFSETGQSGRRSGSDRTKS